MTDPSVILDKLVEYSSSKGRVCPIPVMWDQLWGMLKTTVERETAGYSLFLAYWRLV